MPQDGAVYGLLIRRAKTPRRAVMSQFVGKNLNAPQVKLAPGRRTRRRRVAIRTQIAALTQIVLRAAERAFNWQESGLNPVSLQLHVKTSCISRETV